MQSPPPHTRVSTLSPSSGAANLELDPLDDTRIHPASYGWAVQMAQSAVADDDAADAAAAVENAFARPQVGRLGLAERTGAGF